MSREHNYGKFIIKRADKISDFCGIATNQIVNHPIHKSITQNPTMKHSNTTNQINQ